MLKKEGALNEMQRQREQLWSDREGIVSGIQRQLEDEKERMRCAWEGSKREWDELKAQHNELQARPLATHAPCSRPSAHASCSRPSIRAVCSQVSLSQRRLDAERLHEGVARESAQLLTELQARAPTAHRNVATMRLTGCLAPRCRRSAICSRASATSAAPSAPRSPSA